MSDDLVKRADQVIRGNNKATVVLSQTEAVALLARIEALTAERDHLFDKLELERALTDGAHRRARKAEAERDALKAALNFMRGCIIHARTELAQSSQDMSAIRAERALARATLAEINGESHE